MVLTIKRSRMNAFWTICIPLISDLSGQVASVSTDFGNLSVEYKITLFSSILLTSPLPFFSLLFFSMILFFCLFDYVCGLNTTKKKYQTTSKVILRVLIALYFHQILSNFPTGKRIPLWEITASHVCQMSLNLVNPLIKMKWSSYYDMQVLVFEALILGE